MAKNLYEILGATLLLFALFTVTSASAQAHGGLGRVHVGGAHFAGAGGVHVGGVHVGGVHVGGVRAGGVGYGVGVGRYAHYHPGVGYYYPVARAAAIGAAYGRGFGYGYGGGYGNVDPQQGSGYYPSTKTGTSVKVEGNDPDRRAGAESQLDADLKADEAAEKKK
jgi:hypothetical protein